MDVEQDELRRELRGGVEARGPVLGLADHVEALGLEDGAGTRAKARVIVDDQDVHSGSIVASRAPLGHTGSHTVHSPMAGARARLPRHLVPPLALLLAQPRVGPDRNRAELALELLPGRVALLRQRAVGERRPDRAPGLDAVGAVVEAARRGDLL